MTRFRTEERQAQIIDEAIRIIHEQGYSALAIRELARQVGITEPAIYRHFTSKDEIIAGILDRVLQMSDTLLSDLAGISSAREKIRRFVLFHFDFLSENPEITSVVFSEDIFRLNPILRLKLQKIVDSRYQVLRSFVDEARREGSLVDTDAGDMTILIIGTIRLIVLDWRLSDFDFDLKARGDRILRTLERLIFTEDPELDKQLEGRRE